MISINGSKYGRARVATIENTLVAVEANHSLGRERPTFHVI